MKTGDSGVRVTSDFKRIAVTTDVSFRHVGVVSPSYEVEGHANLQTQSGFAKYAEDHIEMFRCEGPDSTSHRMRNAVFGD